MVIPTLERGNDHSNKMWEWAFLGNEHSNFKWCYQTREWECKVEWPFHSISFPCTKHSLSVRLWILHNCMKRIHREVRWGRRRWKLWILIEFFMHVWIIAYLCMYSSYITYIYHIGSYCGKWGEELRCWSWNFWVRELFFEPKILLGFRLFERLGVSFERWFVGWTVRMAG